MTERKRFVLLAIILCASIALYLLATSAINDNLTNQL